MAIWAVQQAGNFATVSSDLASPWYDAGAQAALASIPAALDTITNAGAFDLTFDIDLPAVTSVLDSDTVYGAAGTYHAPEAAEVIDSATFGPASAVTGTVSLPEVTDVIEGVDYGPGDGLTGTFDESARNTDPGVINVLAGVGYKILNAAKTGTLAPSSRYSMTPVAVRGITTRYGPAA